MAKKAQPKHRITNRRARYDYELGDDLVVGISLTGAETKALRQGHGQLAGAFVNIKDGELWLYGAKISPTNNIAISSDDQIRNRKLLAKRREIEALAQARQDGRAIVPLEILTGGRYIKLRIAVGKGLKRYDKRENIKRRQAARDIERHLK